MAGRQGVIRPTDGDTVDIQQVARNILEVLREEVGGPFDDSPSSAKRVAIVKDTVRRARVNDSTSSRAPLIGLC